MAVGNIQGIEPSRNRDEDKAARAALDSAENKQPPVQGYSFTQAPSPSGAVKVTFWELLVANRPEAGF